MKLFMENGTKGQDNNNELTSNKMFPMCARVHYTLQSKMAVLFVDVSAFNLENRKHRLRLLQMLVSERF